MELSIHSVSKFYGQHGAVRGFTATLDKGVTALLGPNGAGKTTLLRILCDILAPTQGEVRLGDVSLRELGERYRALLGYLPQSFGYYPAFTGWDFLMYFSALKGLGKDEAQKRSEELLEQMGLWEVRRKKLKTYSGGMLQRLGIAQALLNDPKVLILDEPTSGLDPKERMRFRNLIGQLSSDRLILFSTHIVTDIEFLAERILIMKEGSLARSGSAVELCSELEGKVWELEADPHLIDRLSSHTLVSRIRKTQGGASARLISSTRPHPDAVQDAPKLEDFYLNFFREAEHDPVL